MWFDKETGSVYYASSYLKKESTSYVYTEYIMERR